MIALNEQHLIRACLESARAVVDEIIVGLDRRTRDRTPTIARRFGAKIIDVDWRDDFSYARNTVFDAATGDWLLVLDADDRLTPAGAEVIRCISRAADALVSRDVTALVFELQELALDGTDLGRWIGSARLFRASAGLRYSGRVHEEVVQNSQWAVLFDGPHIAHLGSDPLLREQRGKDERNMRLLELSLRDDPDHAGTHYNLARECSFAGDTAAAITHAQAALRANELAPFTQRTRLLPGVVTVLRELVATGSADWHGAVVGRASGSNAPDPNAYMRAMRHH